jgi:RTX calcium-binding nonapeptide repeat (4 copies)
VDRAALPYSERVTSDAQGRRRRLVPGVRVTASAAFLAAAIAGGAATGSGVASTAAPRSTVVVERVEQRPAEVRDYWTARRMRGAEPLQIAAPATTDGSGGIKTGAPAYAPPVVAGERAPLRTLRRGQATGRAEDASAGSQTFPLRVHGKVFLTLGDTDYVCSATVVDSASHTVVWTAGHCVNGADIGLGFATNWMFVPGYREGQTPYGSWTASELMTTDGWKDGADLRADVGAAILERDSEGRGVQDVVGARGIAFNQSRSQTFDAYGFPAVDPNTPLLPPNFDGEHLFHCRSGRAANDAPPGAGPETMEIDCDMTAGASGGGWVIDGGYVNSVTSYGYEFDPSHLFGPYFGSAAKRLYEQASGPRLVCAGRAVTNLGGPGADVFTGGAGADSFSLARGADRAGGLEGSDAACGGGGDDGLRGGPGADRLHGQGGDDLLIGGPGRDVCDGGPGHDAARGCEVKRHIP